MYKLATINKKFTMTKCRYRLSNGAEKKIHLYNCHILVPLRSVVQVRKGNIEGEADIDREMLDI